MRVVHVIGYYQPGLGYEEEYLPARQRDKGVDAIILTSDRPSPWAGIARTLDVNANYRFPTGWSRTKDSNVPVFRVPLLIHRHGQTMLRQLFTSLQKLRPDVVHCHDVTSPLAAQVALAQRLMRFALVYDSHALYDAFRVASSEKQLFLVFHRTFLRRAIARSADSILALTEETGVLLQNELGFPKELITSSSLGVDATLFRPIPEARNSTRIGLGLPPDAPVILYVGKVAPWKQVGILIESFARLAIADFNAYLVLVGSVASGYQEYLKTRIRDLGIVDRVLWHGPVANRELPAFYSSADVCVWPAASSMAVFEAFACSVAVILRDNPANVERVSPNRGHVYDGTVSQLTERISRLLGDPELRRQLGRNAMEYAREQLDWGKIADRTIKVYEHAVLQV